MSSAQPDWKVQLFKLNFDESEIEAVVETLRSGWITMGQQIGRAHV